MLTYFVTATVTRIRLGLLIDLDTTDTRAGSVTTDGDFGRTAEHPPP